MSEVVTLRDAAERERENATLSALYLRNLSRRGDYIEASDRTRLEEAARLLERYAEVLRS